MDNNIDNFILSTVRAFIFCLGIGALITAVTLISQTIDTTANSINLERNLYKVSDEVIEDNSLITGKELIANMRKNICYDIYVNSKYISKEMLGYNTDISMVDINATYKFSYVISDQGEIIYVMYKTL